MLTAISQQVVKVLPLQDIELAMLDHHCMLAIIIMELEVTQIFAYAAPAGTFLLAPPAAVFSASSFAALLAARLALALT